MGGSPGTFQGGLGGGLYRVSMEISKQFTSREKLLLAWKGEPAFTCSRTSPPLLGKGVFLVPSPAWSRARLPVKLRGPHLVPDEESSPATLPALVSKIQTKSIPRRMIFTLDLALAVKTTGPSTVEEIFIQWDIKDQAPWTNCTDALLGEHSRVKSTHFRLCEA